VSLYLDASVLVALFVIDPASARAAAFLASHPAIILVSDFGAAEFSSALARRVRMRDLTRGDGLLALEHFDTWDDPGRRPTGDYDSRHRGGGSNFAASRC